MLLSLAEDWIVDVKRCQALVDVPSVGFDLCPTKGLLQLGGFVYLSRGRTLPGPSSCRID